MRNHLNALALAFLIGSLAAGGSLAAAPLAGVATNFAGVTVKATPGTLSGAIWEFKVVLDTHSQDLSDDLAKSSVLLDGTGGRHAPIAWEGSGPGGHHREGTLRFDAPSQLPGEIELQIRRPGETEPRSFRWQLK